MAKSRSTRRPRAAAKSSAKAARPAKPRAAKAAKRPAKAARKALKPARKAKPRARTARPAATARPTSASRPKAASARPRTAKANKATARAKAKSTGARPPAPTTKTTAKAAPRRAPRAAVPVVEAERLPSIPSSLTYPASATAARSGARELRSNRAKHTDTSPALTSGDIDASWEEAASSGDEAPGGDNPTPDQDVVDEIGLALGIEYADNEELEGGAELERRDRHRWEYDPASAEDYIDRLKNES